MTSLSIAAIAAACVMAAPALACPDWTGAPHFGQIELWAAFQPDPDVRDITAGGTQNLATCGLNAAGFVTTRPDFDLYWNGQSAQLTFAVESGADAALLITGPNGEVWHQDDVRESNPVITLANPPEGLCDIWNGTYDGSRRNPGRLIITGMGY